MGVEALGVGSWVGWDGMRVSLNLSNGWIHSSCEQCPPPPQHTQHADSAAPTHRPSLSVRQFDSAAAGLQPGAAHQVATPL